MWQAKTNQKKTGMGTAVSERQPLKKAFVAGATEGATPQKEATMLGLFRLRCVHH